MSPDVPEVAEVGEKCPYDGLGPSSVGALEVAYSTRVTLASAGRACGRGKPQYRVLVMRIQGLADREGSVGNRPVETSRWATSPILVWVSRAARRSLSKAVIAST